MRTIQQLLIGLVTLCSGAIPAASQIVELSPVPRQASWGDAAFSRPESFTLSAPSDLDPVVLKAVNSKFRIQDSSLPLIVGKRGDSQVGSVESKIPVTAEGYYLSVTPSGVTVAGNDDAGLFYGIQTLSQIVSVPQVMSVEITDWPSISARGVIEGFYGNPWSFADRMRQFDFYGANKLNIYIYGPKDDPYHHSRWYEPYPEDKAAEIRQLVAHAADNKVRFVWAMHPGNSIATEDDRSKALTKFELMYDMGIRDFAVFFDDISAESVDNQISYLNFLTDKFVRAHNDISEMIVCPTQYNKAWSGGDYLSKMGSKLYPGIRIMWTGNSVVDMIQKEDCDWFKSQTGRDPFIWLNYPVNDYGLHHLLMGPLTGNGKNIANNVSAFCSNPMQYAEASMVALYGIADYSWNIEAYDPQSCWERSMAVLLPGHTAALRTFCIHNVDVGPSTHGLRLYDESPEFKALTDKYPKLNAESADAYAGQFAGIKDAADELLAIEDAPLVNEIREFIQYFGYQGQRGLALVDMSRALESGQSDAFVAAYRQYAACTEAAETLVSRGYQGSIQSVAPRTGSLYVEPFIKNTAGELAAAFRESGVEYPSDLFPAQVVENGIYRIVVDGKYLTNVSGSRYPTLKGDIDEVNPGRQQWVITLDPETNRYKIVNEWDKRYVNEKGEFTVNESTNPYESAWHSYQVYRIGDRYAIQNAGSAGNNYWEAGSNRLQKSSVNEMSEDMFIFDIQPVIETATLPYIVSGQKSVILDRQGRVLFNDGSTVPVFVERPEVLTNNHKFIFRYDQTKKRYRLYCVAGSRYINELGVFGVNAYSNEWNTYLVLAKGDLYAIRNAEKAGKAYWTVKGDRIERGGENPDDPYQFRIVDAETVDVEEITSDSALCFSVLPGCITVSGDDARSITVRDLMGRVVAVATDTNRIDINCLHGIYILTVITETTGVSAKVVID